MAERWCDMPDSSDGREGFRLIGAAATLKPFAQRNSVVFRLALARPDEEGERYRGDGGEQDS